MKAILKILGKQFVQQFYIANAGFFLFFFFFFFGIVHPSRIPSYHHSLMLSVISSPAFMVIVMVGWLLYNIKCISFCNKLIHAADGNYLHVLIALPAGKQWSLYAGISAALYLPVMAYAAFMVQLAMTKQMLIPAILIIAFQLLMVIIGASSIYSTVNSNRQSWVGSMIAGISNLFCFEIGYNYFLIGQLLHSRKMAVLLVKIFSLLLLSVSFIRNGDDFDADLFGIFFQLIMAAHATLVFYCVDFEETLMPGCRNLPIAFSRIAGRYLLTWLILLLPEAAFMFINNHGNLPLIEVVFLSLTAVATLLLYTGLVYASSLNMERYMFVVFICFIMIFFLQKAGMHGLSLLAILLAGLAVLKSHYYLFEKEKL